MRKVFVFTFFIFLGTFVSCKKDNAKSKVKKENVLEAVKRDKQMGNVPEVTFDREIHDFGTVNEGDIVETVFVVTNSGKSDLIILDAKASCGCTVPIWSKEPIAPGKTGELKVKFDTSGRPNKQSKTVTITTNTKKGKETVKISGMVKPKNKE